MEGTTSMPPDQDVISDNLTRIIGHVGFGYINLAICIFGCFANIVNMVVFYKLGLKETINLGLLVLAISDFGCVFTLIPLNIFSHLGFYQLELNFEPTEMTYLTSFWPSAVFTRTTILLTAYVTMERCLCVTFPLKVKTILTRRRVVFLVPSFFALAVASAVPVYYSSSYGPKYFPHLNKTLLGLVLTDDSEEIKAILSPVSNALLALLPFVFICVCTVILVISLKRKVDWRMHATAGDSRGQISLRKIRVCKMVMSVSLMFIILFLPSVVVNIIVFSRPSLNLYTGKYRNVTRVYGVISTILRATNSSMNIFIYFKFSTNYRLLLKQLFRLGNGEGLQ